MEVIHVSSRGQIVIPEHVRKRTGIQEGSRLILQEEENRIILKKESFVETQLSAIKRKEDFAWLSLSEKTLAKDWLSPEEDAAWKNL